MSVGSDIRVTLSTNYKRYYRNTSGVTSIEEFGTAKPTTGSYVANDVVHNTNKTELGTTGSMYVIDKWVCRSGGTPGQWYEVRGMTGN